MSSFKRRGRALLLPVKDLGRAKSRLGQVFSRSERQQIAWALFQDVCEALQDCQAADCIAVVSTDPDVLQRAERTGWTTLAENGQQSESASVDWACRCLSEEGFQSVLRLPADLPLLQASDVDRLLAADRPDFALLVPSRDGTGTNALLRNPPNAFPSFFGPQSLNRHLQAARSVGLAVSVVENARVALDMDTPSDVIEFLQRPRPGHTLRTLQQMKAADRLEGIAE